MSDDLLRQLDAVQAQMQQVQRRLSAQEASVMDIQQALATLQAVADGQTAGPVLVPVGGGVHLRATLHADQPVVRPLGSDTAVDGTLGEAQAALATQRDRFATAMQQTGAQLEQLSRAANDLQQQLAAAPLPDA